MTKFDFAAVFPVDAVGTSVRGAGIVTVDFVPVADVASAPGIMDGRLGVEDVA